MACTFKLNISHLLMHDLRSQRYYKDDTDGEFGQDTVS